MALSLDPLGLTSVMLLMNCMISSGVCAGMKLWTVMGIVALFAGKLPLYLWTISTVEAAVAAMILGIYERYVRNATK